MNYDDKRKPSGGRWRGVLVRPSHDRLSAGQPVVDWFYGYGNPVGPAYGTRYKSIFAKEWSGALNYEFNYKVIGMTVK